MLLSIIIPVYNVERYLTQCLDSVLACDLTDCEIILSLGKSDDGSDALCDAYQDKNPMIRIVRQDGRGLSNARNCAMRIAGGDNILFLDSDDFVDSTVLDGLIGRLRNRAINAELIVTDFFHLEHPSGKLVPFFQIGADTPDQTGMDFLPRMLRKRQCFWNVWRYIYRRDFLERNELRFMENRMSEDVDFTARVFAAEPEIIFTHSPFYFYNVGRGASLMDRPTLHRLEDTVFILTGSIIYLAASKFRYARNLQDQFRFEYLLNMALAVEIDPVDRASALTLFQDWKQTLAGTGDPIVRSFGVLLRFLGVNNTAWLLHTLKMLRRRLRGRKTGERQK